jgi:hypothetical protein
MMGPASAIPNVFFSSNFRCASSQPPHRTPPFHGGAPLDRGRLRFAGSSRSPWPSRPLATLKPLLDHGGLDITKTADLQVLKPSPGLEPGTASLPWRFRGVTRVHGRSRATYFFLQIDVIPKRRMRREASHVSFLMCPFCVRALVPSEATYVQTRAGPTPKPLAKSQLNCLIRLSTLPSRPSDRGSVCRRSPPAQAHATASATRSR